MNTEQIGQLITERNQVEVELLALAGLGIDARKQRSDTFKRWETASMAVADGIRTWLSTELVAERKAAKS